MILQPGAAPLCVMQSQICELRLNHWFFVELRAVLFRLSLESIAYDVLQGLVMRETISRKTTRSDFMRGPAVYALVHVLSTKEVCQVRDLRSQVYRNITAGELAGIRALLWRYGVSCVKQGCCVQQAVILEAG